MIIRNNLFRNKLSMMNNTVFDKVKDLLFNEPEVNLLTNIRLGYSTTSFEKNTVATKITGNLILKRNLVLHVGENINDIVLLQSTLSETNSLIFTNTISPYYRGEWVSGDRFINEQGITPTIQSIGGLIIPYSSFKIKSSLTNNNVLYIKIDAEVFNRFGLEIGDSLFFSLFKTTRIDNNDFGKNISKYCHGIDDVNTLNDLKHSIENDFDDLKNEVTINGYVYFDKEAIIDRINYYLDNYEKYKFFYLEYINDYTITKKYRFFEIPRTDYISNINGDKRILLHPGIELGINDSWTIDNVDFYLIEKNTNKGIKIPFIRKEIFIEIILSFKYYDIKNILKLINTILPENKYSSILLQLIGMDLRKLGDTIFQVTHRDFSLNYEYLKLLKVILDSETDEYQILLKYRDFSKNRLLSSMSRNGVLEEYLYHENLSDLDIIGRLLPIDPTYKVFDAKYMEISNYVKSLFKLPNRFNPLVVFRYAIDGLGKIEFLKRFVKTIFHFTVNGIFNQTIEKNEYYKHEHCDLLVFKNGKLIENDVSCNDQEDVLELSIPDNIISDGDKITTRIIPCMKSKLNTSLDIDYVSFIPTNTNHTLSINMNDYGFNNIPSYLIDMDLYLEENTPSDYTYTHEIPNRYMKMNPKDNSLVNKYVDFSTNQIIFDFNDDSYGKTFILVPTKHYTIRLEYNNISKPTDLPLSILLTANSGKPILEINDITVFLNGDEIYNHCDYSLTKIENNDKSVSGYILIIQNMDKLLSNNDFIIYITSDYIYPPISEKWYGVDRYISTDQKLNVELDGIGLISIDGNIKHDSEYDILDGAIDMGENVDKLPYTMKYYVPLGINILFSNPEDDIYTDTLDFLLGDSHDKYFVTSILQNSNIQKGKFDYPKINYDERLTSVLNHEYNTVCNDDLFIRSLYPEDFSDSSPNNSIYSSYISKIVDLIISGDIIVTENMSNEDIDEAIRPYKYLKRFDLLYNDEKLVSKKAFDIHPTVIDNNSLDNAIIQVINYLISKTNT